MRYGLIEMFYGKILTNVLKKQFVKNPKLQELDTKIILNEYKKIIKRAPYIGGSKNMCQGSYIMGAYIISVYKTIKNIVSLSELDRMIADGLNSFTFMKKSISKVNMISQEYRDKIRKYGEWCERTSEKYPNNWKVHLENTNNTDMTNMVFTKCALCNMTKEENVPELINSMCATDFITFSFAKCKLTRNSTIGNGDEKCNFIIERE